MFNDDTTWRWVLACAGFVCASMGPWWAPAVVIVLLAVRFRAWEALALGLIMDFVWLPLYTWPLYFIFALIVVWATEPLRRELLLE